MLVKPDRQHQGAADRLQRQEGERAERRLRDPEPGPAPRLLGGEAQGIVLQRLVGDEAVVVAPDRQDTLVLGHRCSAGTVSCGAGTGAASRLVRNRGAPSSPAKQGPCPDSRAPMRARAAFGGRSGDGLRSDRSRGVRSGATESEALWGDSRGVRQHGPVRRGPTYAKQRIGRTAPRGLASAPSIRGRPMRRATTDRGFGHDGRGQGQRPAIGAAAQASHGSGRRSGDRLDAAHELRGRAADLGGEHHRPRGDRHRGHGRHPALGHRHDGDLRDRLDPGREARDLADQRGGRRARPQDQDHPGGRRLRLADLRGEGQEAPRQRPLRRRDGLLDLGLAQGRAAGLRAV